MSRRTPTPTIDRIWHPETTIRRWHQLWFNHLDAQGHRDDLPRYLAAASEYNAHPWTAELEKQEQITRHDLQAALDVFNRHANATTAHTGLTSHDITEHATQDAIRESTIHLRSRALDIAELLNQQAHLWRDTPLLARTHGQPAQTTSYGYRIATILCPLLDWIGRDQIIRSYLRRPTWGAVGTAADLQRVIGDTSLLEYNEQIATPACATADTMDATRQIYHRSYDLPIANAMVELTSIAQTWATDRRLEAMLGLGNETRTDGQVGSSAMAHKTNPVLCERICSLASLTLGHYTTIASLASQGWLEGDVSTSAARREVWPALFSNVDAILTNWWDAMHRFEPNEAAMRGELRRHAIEVSTGAVLQWLVDHGVARDVAHTTLRSLPVTEDGFMRWATEVLMVAGLDPSRPVSGSQQVWEIEQLLLGSIKVPKSVQQILDRIFTNQHSA